MKPSRPVAWLVLALCTAFLVASCASGPVRRVSDPAARIQQLAVQADGHWDVTLRLQNFSSIPMRFDQVELQLTVAGQDAGTLRAAPSLLIGGESADVAEITLAPSPNARLAVADALAAGRSVEYTLQGPITATPDEGKQRRFETDPRRSALSPAPGLPGVLR